MKDEEKREGRIFQAIKLHNQSLGDMKQLVTLFQSVQRERSQGEGREWEGQD